MRVFECKYVYVNITSEDIQKRELDSLKLEEQAVVSCPK